MVVQSDPKLSSPNAAPVRRTSERIKKMEAKTSIPQKRTPSTSNAQILKKTKLPHNHTLQINPEPVHVADSLAVSAERNVYTMVTETLRTFNKHYLHFIQAEEKRCAREEADQETKTKNCSKSKMMKLNATLYTEKRIGHIPGIDVGHQFFSRAEMVVVGFHQHWLNGIDFIGQTASKSRKKGGLEGYKLPVTNCMEQSVPVRVVRGHKCQNSYVGKVYTYDGLYKVVNYWAEKGVSGFTVYKFRLRRLEGQPPLTTDQVHFTRGRIPKSISEIRGLVCEDITGGLEDISIPVTNLVDDPPISPPGFVYIKDIKFSKNIKAPAVAPVGCNCQGACVDPRSCACAKLNGGDFPYVQRDGGRLVEPKAVVFECGPNCGCGPKCVNRTSQRGPRYRLEVFRTPKKGWGVRSWDYIPSGAPVCEYIGLLKRTEDLDPAADNTYVFDIDCLQTMKGLDGRESRLRDVSLPSYLQKVDEEVSESVPFCIDAGHTGNIARFINHSCQPNLFVQCMLSSHHDIKLARVILVAADNIPPLKELTYDYGYALDSVMGPDGKIRQMACFCGAQECRKRLY
ncbi:UNVERIFIED_CONTAM: Histone-lysine N-methyltransferase, H3 lysine-9 specific SUVH4 [Sesamum radiatum]|uniref:Histone-lysine N-methyltransferase, H3 lysine-9 specific SUVH4 n=1 Tax=Sesamum radiatum TaxID=300843 RepID=A0AAW2P549_SESRA